MSGYKAIQFTFTPNAITGIRAWWSKGTRQPWLEITTGADHVTLTTEFGQPGIDELRTVLRAGLAALDLLDGQTPAPDRHVMVHASWPPEPEPTGEQP